jgi:hypothetical protein
VVEDAICPPPHVRQGMLLREVPRPPSPSPGMLECEVGRWAGPRRRIRSSHKALHQISCFVTSSRVCAFVDCALEATVLYVYTVTLDRNASALLTFSVDALLHRLGWYYFGGGGSPEENVHLHSG